MNRRIAYGIGTVLVFGGIVAAISRTAVVVLGVMWLITLILRPKVALILMAVALPLLVIATAVVPAQVDSMLGSFLDVDTLVASQYTSAGMRGAGRLADLGPAMVEVAKWPFFGQGYGSRIVVGDDANSFILDNQVLSVLMEAGALGRGRLRRLHARAGRHAAGVRVPVRGRAASRLARLHARDRDRGVQRRHCSSSTRSGSSSRSSCT